MHPAQGGEALQVVKVFKSGWRISALSPQLVYLLFKAVCGNKDFHFPPEQSRKSVLDKIVPCSYFKVLFEVYFQLVFELLHFQRQNFSILQGWGELPCSTQL